MSTHTAIATIAKGVVDVIQAPTENPGADEVLLKVEYSAMIPPDAYTADWGFLVEKFPLVLGFTAAGTVAKVGSDVRDIKVGDRVTAFAYGASRNKGFQEYSIQPRTVCSKIPDSLSLEEAATIPDNFICAYYTLFNQLGLLLPSSLPSTTNPPLASTPILIYGAGATAGQYMIRLLQLAGYRKILATASTKHHEHLRSLGASDLFDYKSQTLAEDIGKTVGGDGKVSLVVDCIAAQGTMKVVSNFVSSTGKVALLLPVKQGTTVYNEQGQEELFLNFPIPEEYIPFEKGVQMIGVRTFLYQEDKVVKEKLAPKILPDLLEKKLIDPIHRRIVLSQGSLLQRVQDGLELFRKNKVSGEKVIIKLN